MIFRVYYLVLCFLVAFLVIDTAGDMGRDMAREQVALFQLQALIDTDQVQAEAALDWVEGVQL